MHTELIYIYISGIYCRWGDFTIRPPFYQIHKNNFEAKDLLVTFLQTWPKSFKVVTRWGGRMVAKGGGGWCLLLCAQVVFAYSNFIIGNLR